MPWAVALPLLVLIIAHLHRRARSNTTLGFWADTDLGGPFCRTAHGIPRYQGRG